jgi:hypothetical protein
MCIGTVVLWVQEQSDGKAMVKYIGIFVLHIHAFMADMCLCLHIVVCCWYVIPIGTAFIILTLIHWQSFMAIHSCLSEPPPCCASNKGPCRLDH